jgi:hypothetical protein
MGKNKNKARVANQAAAEKKAAATTTAEATAPADESVIPQAGTSPAAKVEAAASAPASADPPRPAQSLKVHSTDECGRCWLVGAICTIAGVIIGMCLLAATKPAQMTEKMARYQHDVRMEVLRYEQDEQDYVAKRKDARDKVTALAGLEMAKTYREAGFQLVPHTPEPAKPLLVDAPPKSLPSAEAPATKTVSTPPPAPKPSAPVAEPVRQEVTAPPAVAAVPEPVQDDSPVEKTLQIFIDEPKPQDNTPLKTTTGELAPSEGQSVAKAVPRDKRPSQRRRK